MLGESPTSANLGNDHGLIIKEYYLHCYEVYAQSGQYHTIVESRVHTLHLCLIQVYIIAYFKF